MMSLVGLEVPHGADGYRA
jgi:hypothetical protein